MDIRESFSRLKKKFKFHGSKGKPDRAGADPGGEGVGPAGSLLRSVPHVVASGGHNQEDRASADRQQTRSTDNPLPPNLTEPVPSHGSNDDPRGSEGDVVGGGLSQNHFHPHPDTNLVAGSEPSRKWNEADGEKVGQIDPSPSTPLITHSGKPNDNTDTSAVPFHMPEVPCPERSVESDATTDDGEPGQKSPMSVTANLLRGVRDSANGFVPLKPIAGYLYFVLENCQQMEVDGQAIDLLAPRVKALSESLSAPIQPGDINEKERGKKLEQKLKDVCQSLTLPTQQGKVVELLSNTENAQRVNGLVEDIRETLMDYQTSLQQDIYHDSCQQIGSADLAILKGMHHTEDASYLNGNRQGCLRGTRKGVLWEIEHWLVGDQDQQIFWLNGLAGTGKSTIAQTFAERAFADGKLGASFFCSRDSADQNNLQIIFPTLAFQLAFQYRHFREKLLQVLKGPDATKESLCSQMEKLIVGPLKAAGVSTLIIIDALDECRDEEPASAILSILSRYVNEIPGVKFFITGRPEPHIHSGFHLKSLLPITEVLKLHEVKPETVNNDIRLFFQTQLAEYAENRIDCNLQHWPSSSEIDILCEKAAGFFIYASTVIKFIKSKSYTPIQRLNQITSLPQSTSHEGKSGIDILYAQVLKQAVDDVDADDEEFHTYFRTVVGTVLLVFNPLSVEALSDLLRESGVSTTLHSLHSLLLVPINKDDPVRVFHKSFPDFLMDKSRCSDLQFFIDPKIHHEEILISCLKLIRERLKKNICGLDDYAILSEVKDLACHQKDYIGDALEYACCYWTKHLVSISGSGPGVEEVQEAIGNFFTTCLLFWIEVLSLVGKLDSGVHALNNIQQWYTLAGNPCKWANDCQRLLLEWFDTIHDSPSQVYHIALPFSPSTSWLHEYYAAELSREVKVIKGIPTDWGTCSRTVRLDDGPQALARWGDTVAVGLDCGDIVTLDRITGIQTAILSGHTGCVRSLTFSPDGISLVSGSDDGTIKLWDVQTGGVVKTFNGHTCGVCSVSISANSTVIASGSIDKTIRLWDIQTEKCYCVIKQKATVDCVRFSPTEPQNLMSTSDYKHWFWDINGDQTRPPHNGFHIAFSLDGTQLVMCQASQIVVINLGSWAAAEFYVSGDFAKHCCFSPDGRLIAVATRHKAYICDTTSSGPHPMETFIEHTSDITSLVFSSPSSLISASIDRTIKFWQVGSLQGNPVVNEQEPTPLTSAPIKFITLQAEYGIAASRDSEGVVRVWDISTGLCKATFQSPAKDPEWSSVWLTNSRLIFVWVALSKVRDWTTDKEIRILEDGKDIHIWDVEKRQLLQSVGIILSQYAHVEDVKMSGDGSMVFCLHWGAIQALSISTGEVVDKVELELVEPQRSLAVVGLQVWVHSPQLEPLGWDFGIQGSPPVQLSNTSLPQPNNTKLWDIGESRIKDAVTGEVVFQLAGKFAKPAHSQWDGQYLVTGYGSGEVLILDFNHILH